MTNGAENTPENVLQSLRKVLEHCQSVIDAIDHKLNSAHELSSQQTTVLKDRKRKLKEQVLVVEGALDAEDWRENAAITPPSQNQITRTQELTESVEQAVRDNATAEALLTAGQEALDLAGDLMG